MRLFLFVLWAATLGAQPRAITLTKEVPGGVVNLGTVATPTVDNDTGTYNTNTVVTFSDATTGALIWTCSGVADCTPDALNNPITVTVTGTHVCAVAKKVDYTDSARKCATITLQVATPTFDPVAGAVDNPTTVTFSSTTPSVVFCHNEGDGTQAAPTATTPGTCATGTTGATTSVTAATTIKVIGTKVGWVNSAAATAAYTITAPPTVTARAFNGTNAYLTGSTSELSGATAFTIAFWMKSANTAQTNTYAIDLNGNTVVLYGYANAAGVAQVELYGAVGDALRAGSQITIPDTNWHHVAYRYNGTEWASFLDGTKTIISSSVSSGINSGSGAFKIATSGTSNLFAGSIARVYLSTSALTDGQISTLAGTCSTSGVSGTVGYWLLTGDVSPETESAPSGGSNSLTVTNATKDTGGPTCSAQ